MAGWKLDSAGNRVWVDDAGYIPDGGPPPGALAYMGGGAPATGYDPLAIRDSQRQGVRQAGVAAGIGAAAELGQFGLSFINTAQDTRNKKRLGELEGLERSGKLGLSGAERQQAEQTLMDPVRAFAGEERGRVESTIAAQGGTTSAADLTRTRRESDRRVDQASIAAGTEISRANLAAAAEQRNELDERASYQSDRQRSRIDMLGQTLLTLAGQTGKVLAANPAVVGVSASQLRAMQAARRDDGSPVYPGLQGLTDDQLREAYQLRMRGADTGTTWDG